MSTLYLCGDDARAGEYIRVEQSQLDLGGPWFSRVFGTTMKKPDPVALVAGGAPIYPIAVPHAVLREFVHGLRFPTLLPDMARHLPTPLRKTMSLATWRTYLEYHGLLGEDDTAAAPPPPKKPKLALSELTSLQHVYYRRAAQALAAEIMLYHPGFLGLGSGATKTIQCHFVNRRNALVPDYTYRLAIPGDPPAPPMNVACAVGIELPLCFATAGACIHGASQPCHAFFTACLEGALGASSYKCSVTMLTSRASKEMVSLKLKYWPTAEHTVRACDYDVLRLLITHVS